MRSWKKMHNKARVYAIDAFYSDAAFDLECELIAEAPPFNLDRAEDFLSSLHGSFPVTLIESPLYSNVVGYYEQFEGIIILDNRQKYEDTVLWQTLCHELAHHYLYKELGIRGPHHCKQFLSVLRMIIYSWHIFVDDNPN